MHDLLEVLPRCDWSTLAHLAGPSRNILRHLQQGFTTREMGPDVILRGNNPQDRMSALPPKADIETRSRDVRFVPKADSCSATKNGLVDHLISTHFDGSGQPKIERCSSFAINNQLKLNRLFHG